MLSNRRKPATDHKEQTGKRELSQLSPLS